MRVLWWIARGIGGRVVSGMRGGGRVWRSGGQDRIGPFGLFGVPNVIVHIHGRPTNKTKNGRNRYQLQNLNLFGVRQDVP